MTISKYTRLLMAGTSLAGAMALSTAASAGLITTTASDAVTAPSNAIAIIPLAVESLSASTTTANAQTLGNAQAYNFKFANTFTGKFNVTISLSGAQIATLSTNNVLFILNNGTNLSATQGGGTGTSGYTCTPQILTNTIILTGCDATALVTAAATNAVRGVQLTSVTFTGAGGLNVAGTSVTFSGQVTDSTGAVLFETVPVQNIVTSYQALTTSNTSTGGITVDATSSPVFTTVSQSAGAINLATNAVANAASTGALTAVLGQVSYGTTVTTATGTAQAKKTDFTALNMNDIVGNHVLTLTSPVLALPAVTQVVVANFTSTGTSSASSITLSKPVANPATATLVASTAALDNIRVTATFDGATAIPTTGAGTVVDVPTAGTITARTFAGVSGTLVGVTQGGYTNGVNNVLNSKNTGFASYIRIHNNSASSPNTVTLNVYNNATGALLGSYTTPSVPANGSLQIAASDIELGANITATAGVNYDIGIRGTTFSGYVQHILFNTALGLAVDLSGNRGTTPK